MWILYEFFYLLGFLLYLPSAIWRRRLPHRGWTMRLGRYPDAVAASLQGRPSVWVHAVSVGEALAARPLLAPLAERARQPLVMSTITPGGFDVASRQMEGRGPVVYFPLDLGACVSRALDALKPRLLLLMESELWPNAIRLAASRGIPIAVVNGRLSPRAFARYQWVKPWVRTMLGRVTLFLMQSQADADRLLALGVAGDKVRVAGNLKWDASLGARPAASAAQELMERLSVRSADIVVVAGSTHRGEETAVLDAFQALRASHAEARLILAPRHLERLAEVEALIAHRGLPAARISKISGGTWQVGLVDVFGQLPLYYGLATVVFIGGSLIPHGGQNPLEAAGLGKPVVFGPSMHNFEAITHQLLAHHAARQAENAQDLGRLLEELVSNRSEADAMGRRAQALIEQFQGATQRTLDALAPFLTHPSSTT